MATKAEQLRGAVQGRVGDGTEHAPLAVPLIVPDNRRAGLTRLKDAVEIPIDRINRDENQPRQEFDEPGLSLLAESLKTRGQLQPIRVRWDEGRGLYVIICGERRWRAARMAGLASLACMVHDGPIDVLAVQLIENALREDLKPVEQARAFRALLDANGWDSKTLAAELAIEPAKVTRTLALLSLPEEVQEQVEQGTLAATTAYEVSRLPGPPEAVAEVAKVAVEEGLTRLEARELVRNLRSRKPAPARKPEPVVIETPDCTITVRWKRPSPVTAREALRQAVESLGQEDAA